MEKIKESLVNGKERYILDTDMIISELEKIKEEPMLIMTELYGIAKNSKVGTNAILYEQNVCKDTYLPLLQSMDIFNGCKLFASSTAGVFSVYVDDVHICTFDIRCKEYFGVLKEPIDYSKSIKNLGGEICNEIDSYLASPTFINKYKVLKAFKNSNFFEIMHICISIDKDKMEKFCLKLQLDNESCRQAAEQEENKYKENLRKYSEHIAYATMLYKWLNEIEYKKI